MRNRWMAILLLGALCAMPACARNQDSFTPMPLDAGFGPLNFTAPAIPPAKIIADFTAREAVYRDALHHYTYRRIARVDTIDDDTHKVDGEYYEVDDVIFDSTGARTEKVVYAPPSTLTRVMMSPSDFQDIQHNYQFVLTPENIGEYDVKYVGRQRIDQIDCYVFDVTPKAIEKHKRYFKGRIWVDTEELEIVVTNGWMVPDDTKPGNEDLHPPFMTWRQQIDGDYWFPVYSIGEGVLHFTGGNGYMAEDVHIREVVKYTDYKRFGTSSTIIYDGQDITKNGQQPNAGKPPKQ
ncbi:MAG: hypothetical protein ACRD19_07625 [Terriglobia bacterium]